MCACRVQVECCIGGVDVTWGRMDDKAHRNSKVRKLYRMGALGREAYGVWTYRWSWCLDSPDLDGFIPDEELDEGERRCAELLSSALHNGRGLWRKVDGGYVIHDFHEYNPTKKQRQKKLRADRERMAEKRAVEKESHATRERLASESPPRARAGLGMGTYWQESREEIAVEPLPPTGDARLDAANADLGMVRPIRRVVR